MHFLLLDCSQCVSLDNLLTRLGFSLVLLNGRICDIFQSPVGIDNRAVFHLSFDVVWFPGYFRFVVVLLYLGSFCWWILQSRCSCFPRLVRGTSCMPDPLILFEASLLFLFLFLTPLVVSTGNTSQFVCDGLYDFRIWVNCFYYSGDAVGYSRPFFSFFLGLALSETRCFPWIWDTACLFLCIKPAKSSAFCGFSYECLTNCYLFSSSFLGPFWLSLPVSIHSCRMLLYM